MLEYQKSSERVFLFAVVLLAVLILACLPWGWKHSASAAIGGLMILASASATELTITLGLGDKEKRAGKTWWHLVPRLLLIALCGYAMLQTPWMEYIPLVLGLSIFFPALIIEVILEGIALGQRKDSNQELDKR